MSAFLDVDCSTGCGRAFSWPVNKPLTDSRCHWCATGLDPNELAGQWDAAIAAMPWPHLAQQEQSAVAA